MLDHLELLDSHLALVVSHFQSVIGEQNALHVYQIYLQVKSQAILISYRERG